MIYTEHKTYCEASMAECACFFMVSKIDEFPTALNIKLTKAEEKL